MDVAERRALAALRFNWAPTPDDVWRTSPYHVDGLHKQPMQAVLAGLAEAVDSVDSSPIGAVVLGHRGVGKTHLLGAVREHVQTNNGYFFLVSLLDASAFWRSTALSMLDGFARTVAGRDTQLRIFLRNLANHVDAPRGVRRAIVGETELTRSTLDAFVDLLRKAEPQIGLECRDTARALTMRAGEDPKVQDVGYNFLCSNDEEEPGERAEWGIRRGRRSAQEIVRDMSRLLALTGPTVIAVDQIDLLIAQSAMSTAQGTHPRDEWREALLLEQIAGGLMALREMTRRTLSVVACLPVSWKHIETRATDTVQDRFRKVAQLMEIGSASLAEELVEKRFAARFREIGFTPRYPTWPVSASAFPEAVDFTPRELLITIDTHVRSCLLTGEIRELKHLTRAGVIVIPPEPPSRDTAPAETVADVDARFTAFRNAADPAPALDPQTEDEVVPELLAAGLTAWLLEQGADGRTYSVDPRPGAKPALHARLRRSLDESRKDREDEAHWAFRAIAASHAVAALNRIRNAATAAGLNEGITRRRLFLLRNDEWSAGPRTKEVVAAFEAAGGRRLPFPPDDVKTLIALRDLLRDEDPEKLRPWFVARRPTRDISVLCAALADGGTDAGEEQPPESRTRPTNKDTPSIRIGTAVPDGTPVTVELEALRKHTAVFAGSGSGKTVLIRRLIEECALKGVSAIVLDPNNDLARLGDPWPEPPAQWTDDDRARASEYIAHTDVVVWTPRREAGRPLSFQPLPDFTGVLDDADEFAAGVDAAVASLAPRAKVDAHTNKAHLGQAVLRQALMHYARQRRSNLKEFISVLAALPHGVSELDNAEKIAGDMAQTLTAAMVNDPLFGGGGVPVDPGLLLTPAPGKRSRVSVVSFVGLPSDEQRQSFVNQLQLALFAWIKRNPAGDRPLGGLFVMDEAQTLAPSGAMTACTQSTLALASQARKYGLGLVFATQAPKALHNRIPGNAATQLFGLLNSPTQIAAAREMARAKGSDIPEISRLRTGQFYAAIEGSTFEKIQASLCLTHHPKSPLTAEEVLERARRG